MNVADLDATDRARPEPGLSASAFPEGIEQSFPDRHTSDGNHAAGIRMAGHANSQVVLHVLRLPGRLIFSPHPVATGEGQTRRFSKNLQLFLPGADDEKRYPVCR